jgi:hypothetical protein
VLFVPYNEDRLAPIDSVNSEARAEVLGDPFVSGRGSTRLPVASLGGDTFTPFLIVSEGFLPDKSFTVDSIEPVPVL